MNYKILIPLTALIASCAEKDTLTLDSLELFYIVGNDAIKNLEAIDMDDSYTREEAIELYWGEDVVISDSLYEKINEVPTLPAENRFIFCETGSHSSLTGYIFEDGLGIQIAKNHGGWGGYNSYFDFSFSQGKDNLENDPMKWDSHASSLIINLNRDNRSREENHDDSFNWVCEYGAVEKLREDLDAGYIISCSNEDMGSLKEMVSYFEDLQDFVCYRRD